MNLERKPVAMRKSYLHLFGYTAVIAVAATVAIAQTPGPVAVPLDTEQSFGAVDVVCTGIGESRNDVRWKAYPIRVEASNAAGDLLANVAISLSKVTGAPLATVSCEGPWIMLRAAAGAYRFDAWMPGETFKHQTGAFNLPSRGQRIVSVRFPAS